MAQHFSSHQMEATADLEQLINLGRRSIMRPSERNQGTRYSYGVVAMSLLPKCVRTIRGGLEAGSPSLDILVRTRYSTLAWCRTHRTFSMGLLMEHFKSKTFHTSE